MGILTLLDNCYNEQLNEAASSLTNSEILDKYCNILSNYIFPQLAQYTDFPGISSPVTWREKGELIVLDINGSSNTLYKWYNSGKNYKVNSSIFSPSAQEFRLKVNIGTWKNHTPSLNSSDLGLQFRFYLSNQHSRSGDSQKFFTDSSRVIMKKLPDDLASMFSDTPLIFTQIMKEKLKAQSFHITRIWGIQDSTNWDYDMLPPYTTTYKGRKITNIAECIIGYFGDKNFDGQFATGLFKDESTGEVYICFNPIIRIHWYMNYRGKRDNIAENAVKSIFDEAANLWENVYRHGENIVNTFVENTTVSLDDFDD